LQGPKSDHKNISEPRESHGGEQRLGLPGAQKSLQFHQGDNGNKSTREEEKKKNN
jgi:hypothetical protein